MPTSQAVSADCASPCEEARACELGQAGAGERQKDDHQAREARLRGGRPDLALQPRLVFERPRQPSQQPRQVAARALLEQARRHQAVQPRRAGARSERLQRGLRARPGRQLRPRPSQLVPRGTRHRLRSLGQRAAQRVPAAEGVGQRDRRRRGALVDRAPVALAPGSEQAGDGPRPGGCGRQPGERSQRHEAAGERRRRSGSQEPPSLHRSRVATLAAEPDHGVAQRAHRPGHRRRVTHDRGPDAGQRLAQGEEAQRAGGEGERGHVARARTRPSAISSSRVPAPPATRTTSHTDDTRREPSGARVW